MSNVSIKINLKTKLLKTNLPTIINTFKLMGFMKIICTRFYKCSHMFI